jgi:hypothetical protein
MAAVALQSVSDVPRPDFRPIIENVPTVQPSTAVCFDSKKHLSFVPPTDIIKMTDLGYAEDCGISPVAVSQPFQLFSQEAIKQMRSEIFKSEVMKSCSYRSNIAASQVRGYAPK